MYERVVLWTCRKLYAHQTEPWRTIGVIRGTLTVQSVYSNGIQLLAVEQQTKHDPILGTKKYGAFTKLGYTMGDNPFVIQ